jgi:uncharacterized protein (TIGR00299 family) protein
MVVLKNPYDFQNPTIMKLLHIDAFAGISGDMSVAALRDLGVPEEVFKKSLEDLRINLPACRFERGNRNGIAGWRFLVSGHDRNEVAEAIHHQDDHSHVHHHAGHGDDHKHSDHQHDHQGDHHSHSQEIHEEHKHSHTHGDHEHHVHGRNHAEIRTLISESNLGEEVKTRALAVFRRIAIAEGGVHGVPPENVGFHEVGAEDSIADIVCTCAGLDYLKISKITCGPLIEGSGHIHCAHGTFPLPSPATLAILKGIPFRQVNEPWEHITPTGAAILAEFSTKFVSMPEMTVNSIGYGLGSRNIPNRPNVLRLILGESVKSDKANQEEIVELRCNLDDLSPEHASSALDALITAGSLDATLTPTVMKKGRSGWILEVLTVEEKAEELSELMLRQTSAFGIRRHRMERLKLERHFEVAETRYGKIRVKVGTLRGEVIQRSPEFSSCAEAAAHHGVSVRLVHEAALRSLANE